MRNIEEETTVIKFLKLEADGQVVEILNLSQHYWIKLRINPSSKGSQERCIDD